MKPTIRFLIPAGLMTLAGLGCSTDADQTFVSEEQQEPAVVYARPYPAQKNVVPEANITLKLSDATNDPDLSDNVSVVRESDSSEVIGTAIINPNDPTVIQFLPSQPFANNENYTVTISDLETAEGQMIETTTFSFSTAPKIILEEPGGFQVTHHFPDDSLAMLDISTIMLRLSQPLNLDTLTWGETLRLTNAAGELVASTILAKDNRITIDPDQDLEPGQTYQLTISSEVQSLSGDSLVAYQRQYQPLDSGNKATLPLAISPSEVNDGDAGRQASPLADTDMNTAFFSSNLIGQGNEVKVGGYLIGELANVNRFPTDTPFVIRKGNNIDSSALAVMLDGRISAALSTGDITMVTISDAVGYMVDNPLSDQKNAPKNIRLQMDVALHAKTPAANAMMSQSIMHIDIMGTAKISKGRLQIDALGEFKAVLMNGLDEAYTNMVLHFESLDTVPTLEQSDTMTLVSSYPASGERHIAADNTLNLYFDRPLDNSTLAQGLILERSTDEGYIAVAAKALLDGSVVKIRTEQDLVPRQDYRIRSTDALRSITGRSLAQALDIRFHSTPFSEANPLPPMIKALYPGFPCALTGTDISQNIAGRCVGGLESDDSFALFPLPEDRPVLVYFTHPMDITTLQPGQACGEGTIRVEQLDAEGNCVSPVEGRWTITPTKLSFVPNQPWLRGQRYQYVVASDDSNEVCDAGEVCSAMGERWPLSTAPLRHYAGIGEEHVGRRSDRGGPSIVMPFYGVAANDAIFNPLIAMPEGDSNVNGYFDPEESPGLSYQLLQTEIVDGLVTRMNIGCYDDEGCDPNTKKSFISNTMITEVFDYEEALGGIRVHIHPKVLYLSSVTLFADAVYGLMKMEVPTGLQMIRTRQKDGGPLVGVIHEGVDGGPPIFRVQTQGYLDTPYTTIMEGLIETDIKSQKIDLNLEGPVRFTEDGRMIVDLRTYTDIEFDVQMRLADKERLFELFGGPDSLISRRIDEYLSEQEGETLVISQQKFRIPAGDATLYLQSEPTKR